MIQPVAGAGGMGDILMTTDGTIVGRRHHPVGGTLLGCAGAIDAAEAFALHLAARFRFAANFAVAHFAATGRDGLLRGRWTVLQGLSVARRDG